VVEMHKERDLLIRKITGRAHLEKAISVLVESALGMANPHNQWSVCQEKNGRLATVYRSPADVA